MAVEISTLVLTVQLCLSPCRNLLTSDPVSDNYHNKIQIHSHTHLQNTLLFCFSSARQEISKCIDLILVIFNMSK